MRLILTNHNPQLQYRQAMIDITTSTCTLDEKLEIKLEQLFHLSEFSHPLFSAVPIPRQDDFFHYEYDDIEGLLQAGIRVYATLIHADNPLTAQFKINPSPHFHYAQNTRAMYFSIHSHRPAEELVTIKQFEGLISHLHHYPFKFIEEVVINDQFTIHDLPAQVNGDALFYQQPQALELLKTPVDLRRLELRYISPMIGFGVFSRTVIKKNEHLFIYCGIKKMINRGNMAYVFEHEKDCLNMDIDARQYGNITRFINHAAATHPAANPEALAANITSMPYYLNGIELVVYSTNRDIACGEQLLVDYGQPFFQKTLPYQFNQQGKIINNDSKMLFSHFYHKSRELRIMAAHDIKKAQRYLYVRIFIVLVLFFVLLESLNFL
ncbi:SET domain-containing protein-lysine N-methyltransferase [Legionella oakridgensis]|uniref:Protein containing SET domain n=2 Tax=Legionella oakridgensis TaxID=29423 RepID=W0BB40_9GAMM|nr:SET domain-containing protein-lysine N-methyltransferase [Legionella oakridgensis]AHE65906.1 protein containing SET domain [Legionella oakridgensis ATCC 33761 = DSM 21215]ETO94283.1 SET domain protein [Legionella oakridgensis RV-2-2007]KTD43760.1 SET domain protein [Legionella oakridgensis]STY15837.1 SET domain [Legionella longbeachae]